MPRRGLIDPGTLISSDDAWELYKQSDIEYEGCWQEYAKLNGGLHTPLDGKLDRLLTTKFRAWDAWQAALRREADTSLSNVPMSDLKPLVAEALAASAGDLQWKLNLGLIAHRLSEAVYRSPVREEAQDTPLCPACA